MSELNPLKSLFCRILLMLVIHVQYTLSGFPHAGEVILAGSFNDWNERKQRMTLVDGMDSNNGSDGWEARL
jgi:hypothetical protein